LIADFRTKSSEIPYENKIFCCLGIVPQIETESIFLRKRIFSWQKRATKGSSFFALEKNVL